MIFVSYFVSVTRTSSCSFFGECGPVNSEYRGAPVYWENGILDIGKLVAGYSLWLAFTVVVFAVIRARHGQHIKKKLALSILTAIALQALTHWYTQAVYNYDQKASHGWPPYHKLGDGFANPLYNVFFWLAVGMSLLWLVSMLGRHFKAYLKS